MKNASLRYDYTFVWMVIDAVADISEVESGSGVQPETDPLPLLCYDLIIMNRGRHAIELKWPVVAEYSCDDDGGGSGGKV